MVDGDESYNLPEGSENGVGKKGGHRSLLSSISAAISGTHVGRAVRERARISTFERGGFGGVEG